MELYAGVDEVGRGPLAGDVVAAAVILPVEHGIVGLADSKKLSERRREVLCEEIKHKAIAWSLGHASAEEIDQINILQASLLAMKRAVESLSTQPDFVRVDGNKLPQWQYKSEAIVKGDSLYEEISAASIVAKVFRDNKMLELDSEYPGYGFGQHKGYPTKQHLAALETLGASKVHRRSYAPVKKYL